MMKLRLLIWFLMLVSTIHAQTVENPLVSVDVVNEEFEQFAELLEKQSHLNIVFKKEWVNEIRITVTADRQDIVQLIQQVLPVAEFTVTRWNDFIVILRKEELIAQLPDYNSKHIYGTNESDGDTESSSAFLKGRKADLIKIKVGNQKYAESGAMMKVNGNILDAATGLPVENATMYIPELQKGAVSDKDGRISIILPPGKYSARFECLGWKKINSQIEILSDGSFELLMEQANFNIQEVNVYGDRQMNIREKDPGIEKINVKSIKELPTMMGENDIIKVSEMLPGVVSVGEGAAGLNVRGGGFDQNAFYFNKVAIYNTSHMFGFFPAFNSDVINDFSIYKGYIPAKYGGRISSVFNINARTGNKKKYTAHGGISPVAANITIEGPIKRDTASFFLNVRSSYSDYILKLINDPAIRNSKASFYDITAAFDYDLPNTQINVFGYYSQDKFNYYNVNDYRYSNFGLSATVGHQFASSLRGDFSLSASQYQFKTTDIQLESSAYEHQFKVSQYEFTADFQKVFNYKNTLDFGMDAIWYQLNRGEVLPFGEESELKPVNLGDEQGLEAALYISDNFEIGQRLNMNAGFRFSVYAPFGPETVYTYYPDGPKEPETINDSISYKSGQPIKWYAFPEFRISLNYQTDENGNLKLSFNQTHQDIFMLNNTISLAPNSQWKLADYHLKPSRGYQLSFGVFRTIPKGSWDFSAEIFYKKSKYYTEFKDGADFLSTPLIETIVLQGDLKSYGIEFLIKKSWQKLNIWLAYTYSRSLVTVDGENSWDKINNGIEYPSNFDIPNVLNGVFTYHITKRVTFGTTLTYQTGKPTTYPTGIYYIEGSPYLNYSNRNEYRIPNYFRLDIALTIEGNLKKKKLLHSTFNFSVYNLTSRENPYSIFFSKNNGNIGGYQYTVIGVPIFMITWIFKLGNYDAD